MNTKIDVTLADAGDLPRLFEVWESSVRATHAFLAENGIQALIPLVEQGLAQFRPLHCLRDPRRPGLRLHGRGSGQDRNAVRACRLPRFRRGAAVGGIRHRKLGASQVDVNEQNGAALGFYERMASP